MEIRLLDRFEVLRANRPVTPSGQPARALKVVAAARGSMHVEELIEALWPETNPDIGRKRLRNVLNRLRIQCGDVLVREGELVRLAPGVAVDTARFEIEARRAVSLIQVDDPEAERAARSALTLYPGDLLPGDPYAGWAAAPRERLRLLVLRLLDLLAGVVSSRGDPEDAVRLLEHAIEIDRHDEGRYVRAAGLCLDGGRQARAAAFLTRGRAMLEDLGVAPSAELVALEKRLRT